jgi:subtilase family serine protease
MNFDRTLRFVWASFLWSLSLVVLSQPAMAAGPRHTMSPFLRLGSQETPDATPAGVVGPQYHIFTCQRGLALGACYDPYQMRRAYQIDTLINAGFDGSGQTIVIVDAFQNPALATQMVTFDALYGPSRGISDAICA